MIDAAEKNAEGVAKSDREQLVTLLEQIISMRRRRAGEASGAEGL